MWQNSSSNPSALGPLAADAICAQLRFDPVKRNLYYACNEGNHIRVTVGHVGVGQRTGIQYANFNGPRTPGGGSVLNLFPSLATDSAGNVYIAWIDKTNSNLYYSFSTDQGHSWSAPVRVNSSGSATNEFDWAQAGSTGLLTLAWYGTPRTAVGGSDGMPSSLARSRRRDRVPVVRIHGARQGREHREAADPADAVHGQADALRRDLQLGHRLHDRSDRRPPDGGLLRLLGRAGRRPADRLQRHDERVRRRRACS